MPDDARTTIMASRISVLVMAFVFVVVMALFRVMFVTTSIDRTWHTEHGIPLLGFPLILFAIFWSFCMYRLLRYPLIVFEDDAVEIIETPLSRSIKVAFRDIKDIHKSWDSEAKILLVNGKKINVPISFMKNADYEFVFSKIKRGLKSPLDSK